MISILVEVREEREKERERQIYMRPDLFLIFFHGLKKNKIN